MEFRPLGNESSSFCRTEWFHIHVKTGFIWLIGQGGWKLRSRPRLDSWHFHIQTESVIGQKIANLQIWDFFKT